MAEATTIAPSDSPVLVTTENRIRTITINRPEKKNAMSGETQNLIGKHIIEAAGDPDVRVVVITGAGGDFSAGADLSTPRDPKAYDVTKHLRDDVNPFILAMRNSDKPFISKVRGACVGLGCNIALACDMIFASEDARFSEIFVRIGLSTDGGGAYFVPRAIGYPKAFELIATGAMIPAPDAERMGLINRACKSEELDKIVQDFAEKLANGPYVAIQRCKANLREGMQGTLESTLEQEAVSQGMCFKSADFMEGVMAFLQKRKPAYKGE